MFQEMPWSIIKHSISLWAMLNAFAKYRMPLASVLSKVIKISLDQLSLIGFLHRVPWRGPFLGVTRLRRALRLGRGGGPLDSCREGAVVGDTVVVEGYVFHGTLLEFGG